MKKKVANNLIEKGLKYTCHLSKSVKNGADRKKWISYPPLFKSYVFVKNQQSKNLLVLKTPGIVKIVKFGNEVATIDQDSINAIKLMIEGGYSPESTDYFIKGI